MSENRFNNMTSRADLVYWRLNTDEPASSLASIARLIGLEWQEESLFKSKVQVKLSTSLEQEQYDEQTEVIPFINQPKEKISTQWFYVSHRERIKATSPGNNFLPDQPHSIQGIADFNNEDLQSGREEPLELQELVRWSRLWPVLKRVSSTRLERQIDLDELMKRIAKGDLIRRLPRKHHSHWASEMTILLDYNTHVLPFWDDFNTLCDALSQLRGKQGLDIRKLENLPGIYYTPKDMPEAQPQIWTMPTAGTPLLILSDLGMLDELQGQRGHWLRFGRKLQAAGIEPFVLAPVSPDHIAPELSRYFEIALWDRNSHLLRQYQRLGHNHQPELENFLALLAPAIRIEPELLRAVRHLLPDSLYDAGMEACFWQHPDIELTTVACFLRPHMVEKYRTKFQDQPEDLQREVLLLMRRQHAHLFPAIVHEETLIWSELVSEKLVGEFEAEIAQAELFMRKMARMLYFQQDNLDDSKSAYGQRNISRSHFSLRTKQLFYSVVEGVVNPDKMVQGLPLLPGIDKDELRRTLNKGVRQQRQCVLHQHGQDLILTDAQTWQPSTGGHYADLTLMGNSLFINQHMQDGQVVKYCLKIETLPQVIIELSQQTHKISLDTGAEFLWIEGFRKPSWASQIGRDQYGLYNDLNVKGVVQRSRFIPPGSFQMGSPKSEIDRWDGEIQHQVTLTQGYWLADTACTQALWQAVMGENPADFKADKNNPVEQVSWDDVQKFLNRLNDLNPGLNSKLPSEAQWEYACRAGTTTPFSFGENITPEQVNYDGENPYADGKKGLYRGETVSVKSLPANPWGLYEMQGNVWEWCQDWFADYYETPVIDPTGSERGTDRVLRGGSWINDGRGTRSANRYMLRPVNRRNDTGFRFAPGQAKSWQAEPEVAAAEHGKQPENEDRGIVEKLLEKVKLKK